MQQGLSAHHRTAQNAKHNALRPPIPKPTSVRGVGDEVVDVVVALPPAQAEPAEAVGGDDPHHRVGREGVRAALVAGVVGGGDELVTESAQEDAAGAVPGVFQARGEEEAVAG